ncbi:MAG: hypothetical protein QW478_11855 [Candidatus Micrarchaeaceae archaeon]
MVSLQSIQTVTVTSPWSSATSYPYNAEILNPNIPTFAFTYNTNNSAVGFVSGSNASSLYSQCNAIALTFPALYSSAYNAAIIGGSAINCPPCLTINGEFGPWFQIVNLSNGSFISSSSLPCPFIPSNSYTYFLQGLVYDIMDGYMIMSFVQYNSTPVIFYFIPFNEVSTLLSGTFPSTYYTVMVSIPNGNLSVFPTSPYLWNGNMIQPATDSSNNQYIWMIPISTLLQNLQPGNPTGSSFVAGTVYQVYAPGNLQAAYIPTSVMLYPTSSGPKSVIALAGYSSSDVIVTIWDPSTQSTIKQVQTHMSGINYYSNTQFYPASFYKNTLMIQSEGNTLTLLDIVSGNADSVTSFVDAWLVPTSRGYVLGTRNPLNSSSVTFDIYKVSYENDFEFTNVSVSGSTITGTLYNATTGQGVSNQTVYLVQLRSQYSDYIGDSVPVASTTTGSNGQFTIEYDMSPGAYYGLVYLAD